MFNYQFVRLFIFLILVFFPFIGQANFNDIREDHTLFESVSLFEKLNVIQGYDIINGYSDGYFKPSKQISFVESAKIIAQTILHINKINKDLWYQPYVEALTQESSIPTSILTMDQFITRGEMIYMLDKIRIFIAQNRGKGEDFSNYLKDELSVSNSVLHGDINNSNVFIDQSKISNLVELWKFNPEGNISNDPIAWNDIVYVGSDTGEFYALDLKTSDVLWKIQTSASIKSSATLNESALFIANTAGFVYSLDPLTGAVNWEFIVDGGGINALNMSYDKIFMSTDDNSFYAVDVITGKEVWKFKTNASINTDAAIDTKYVYIGDDEGIVYALDQSNGTELWRFNGADVINGHISVNDEFVFVASADTKFYALDKISGVMKWVYYAGSPINTGGAITFDQVYFGDEDGDLYAVNVKDGQKIWKLATEKAIFTAPIIVDDFIYFGNDKEIQLIQSLDHLEIQKIKLNQSLSTNLVIFDKILLFGTTDGVLHAYAEGIESDLIEDEDLIIEPEPLAYISNLVNRGNVYRNGRYFDDDITGIDEFKYSFDINGGMTTPIISDGKAYFGTSNNIIYAFDLNQKKVIWTYKTESSINFTPVIANKKIYFGDLSGVMYSLDLETGTAIWTYKTGLEMRTSPVYKQGMVVFAADNVLFALDSEDGRSVWREYFSDLIMTDPAIDDNSVYIGNNDGLFFNLNLQTGDKIWEIDSDVLDTTELKTASVVVGVNSIFFALSNDFKTVIYGVDPIGPSFIWSHDILLNSEAVLAINDGVLYVTGENVLYAINSKNGDVKWEFVADGSQLNAPIISENNVYITTKSYAKSMYALDQDDGEVIWKLKNWSNWGVITDLIYSNNQIIFGTNDNSLKVFQGKIDF